MYVYVNKNEMVYEKLYNLQMDRNKASGSSILEFEN
jgi:hypothetical protein